MGCGASAGGRRTAPAVSAPATSDLEAASALAPSTMGCGASASAHSPQVASAPSASALATSDLEAASAPPSVDYMSSDSLYALLRPLKGGPAPVRLLKSAYILTLAVALRAATTDDERMRLAMKRRQELEEDDPGAFYTAEEVKALKGSKHTVGGISPLAVVSVSHCWATRDHPDPYGDTIVKLADTILEQQKISMQSHQNLPQDVAVFFDWGSLHQKDGSGQRTPAERRAFDAALDCMQIWYCHPATTVYLMTLPHRDPSVLPYTSRGWPSFESRAACICKGNSCIVWPLLVDVGAAAGAGAKRPAPMAPSRFEELLETKAFTNGSDKAVVAGLYRQTAEALLLKATKIEMKENKLWGDEEMRAIVEFLPLCTELTEASFMFGFYELTDVGAGLLTAAIRAGRMPPKLNNIEFGCSGNRPHVSAAARSAYDDACRERGMNAMFGL